MGAMIEFCNKNNNEKTNKIRYTESNWRPIYHVYPKVGWCNYPNGFCVYKGEYHLFYQYNPYGPDWGPMHWGHVKSKDLVKWFRLPIALSPGNTYDKNGCFSGSALQKGEKLYLLYTGNVDLPSDNKQYQCMALSDDGKNFVKFCKNNDPKNPIIDETPEVNGEQINKKCFKDPKMWKYEDKYYCLLGSKNNSDPGKGQVCLFESNDIEHWTPKSIMLKSPENVDIGYMWECPTFESLNENKDIFICSPQGIKPKDNKFLNAEQSVYFLGKLDYKTGKFEGIDFELLDFGFDFYAPQTIKEDNGRVIMIAWLSMKDGSWPEKQDGWCGMMTIPRELSLDENGILHTKPIIEINKLRTDNIGSKVHYEEINFESGLMFKNVNGVCFIMDIELDLNKSTEVCIKFCVSYNKELVLKYEKDNHLLKLNRDKSICEPKGERQTQIDLIDNILKLNIFMDYSAIEIYAQDGLKVMTSRIYPSYDADKIIFDSKGTSKIKTMDFYNISTSVWVDEEKDL